MPFMLSVITICGPDVASMRQGRTRGFYTGVRSSSDPGSDNHLSERSRPGRKKFIVDELDPRVMKENRIMPYSG